MKVMQGIIALGLMALGSVPAMSHAGEGIYLSQCDGCTAKQAKQKILSENGPFLEQKWYSIDGIAKTVQEFSVNYFPEDPGSLTPTQRVGNRWYYLQPVANDGRAEGLTAPLIEFYNMAPVGWSKTIGPGPNSLSAKILSTPGIARPMSDGPVLPPYSDPAFNAWNTVDASSTFHNKVVEYVENSTVGNIQGIGARLNNMFSAKASLERNGTTISVTPSWKSEFYVVVQFQDGSKLSLVYTSNGWETDPRLGKTTDSNGNSIPITADQIAPPNGIHVYDFRPKSWSTNSLDQQYFTQRAGVLTGGTAVISNSLIMACTSVGGGPVSCQNYNTP